MSGAAAPPSVLAVASAKAAPPGATGSAQYKDAKSEGKDAKQPKPTATGAGTGTGTGGGAADGGFPWICGTCEFTNPGVVVRCVSCDSWNPDAPKGGGTPVKATPKPVGAVTAANGAPNANATAQTAQTSAALARFLPQSGEWTCPSCDLPNKPEQKACRACTTPNPACGGASAPLNAFAAAANGIAGTWECSVCEVPNPASAWECRACTTPNPNPPPRTAPKFAGPNPMAGNPMVSAAGSSSGAAAASVAPASASASASSTVAAGSDAKKSHDLAHMFGLNQSSGSSDVPAFDVSASAQFTFGSNADAALGFAIGGDSPADLKQTLDGSAALAATPSAAASSAAAKPATASNGPLSSTAALDALSPQSRVGRELQRWDGKFRLVGCTVPFRLAAQGAAPASFVPAAAVDTGPPAAGGAAAGATAASGLAADRLEFLLTNSGDGKEWIFPKGGWETDESATEGAARECYEEAGVRGAAVHALPIVEAAKKGGGQMSRFFPFLFRVTEVLDAWPEKHRPRRWVAYDQMQSTLSRDEMRQIWAHAVAAMAAGKHNAPDLPTTGFIPATGAGPDGGAVLPAAAAATAAAAVAAKK